MPPREITPDDEEFDQYISGARGPMANTTAPRIDARVEGDKLVSGKSSKKSYGPLPAMAKKLRDMVDGQK